MIEVFTKPGCGQCFGLELYLKRHRVPSVFHDVSEDLVARERMVKMGYSQVPVVRNTVTGEHWYGFDVARLELSIQGVPAAAALQD
ncbi:glutaredoxin family protein [Paeniglutamicibacter gangotriensis]|uniref:Glutaredoxin family protein n=1 Tax=Paeniglutamicibacter gangotriensis TaxID=254787 RepID=A0A5B0E568_9MICC|nr:glutaredoxin family protein [Paeniglutamicibacter gangotriensis]KAA0973325.1 glutaredoxin family protein [Paeniglutamicibacter gangotriensis]